MTTLIIEDEILSAKNLITLLNEIGDTEIIGCLESITKSVKWFESNPVPDLVFMDIHLADGSAFEIFERTSVNCPVIFTTAFDKYAIKAFKVNSIDYLLKPIDFQSLQNAILKFKSIVHSSTTMQQVTGLVKDLNKRTDYQTSFLIPRKGDKLIPLLVESISCIYIENGITKVINNDSESHFLDFTLDELMSKLNPDKFFRATRQFIIARDAIKDVDLWFNKRLAINLKVNTPERIILSRSRSSEFKNWFTGI